MNKKIISSSCSKKLVTSLSFEDFEHLKKLKHLHVLSYDKK